jgi:hypothetical protein
MSLLPGSPNPALEALRTVFKSSEVWPEAMSNPEAHYQQIAMTFGYVCKTKDGFKLTDLGEREMHTHSGRRGVISAA